MTYPNDLKLLLIDDDEVDRMRIRRFLIAGAKVPFALEEAFTASDGLEKLHARSFDCVLLDFRLPDKDGMQVLQKMGASLDDPPPTILQTVVDDEALGSEAIAAGAQDYLVKGQFDARLLMRTIRYAIQRHSLLREKDRLVRELEEAAANIKQLAGMLPICSHCKKIRDDEGYWSIVEEYITARSEVTFSHGICPDCAAALYPDVDLS
ncbi:MAG: response regulator [bacterium]|nr:response regulator [bacterium]